MAYRCKVNSVAQSDALWNEVARIISAEFFEYGHPITGALLSQCIKLVNEQLTENDASA